LRRDRKLFRSVVADARPRPYRIELDGRDCSGDYLLVEVMNVPALGPQLELSPKSDPGDGHFELVLAGENERAALQRLTNEGRMEPGQVRVERGQRLRIEASEGVHHRDGRLERHPLGPRSFELGMEPAAIVYLR
jgi:diacylglycerol kinase (ATP)